MAGLLDAVLPGAGLLDPQERAQSQNHFLLNMGLGLLANSGPSPVRQSFGQIAGRSGLQALGAMSQWEQNLLRNKLVQAKLLEDKRNQQAEERVRQLVGTPGATVPNDAQGDEMIQRPGTGLVGGQIGLPEFYAQMVGAGGDYARLGISGLTSLQTQQREGFTLSPGQVRYDASGRPLATAGIDPEQSRKDRDQRFKNADTLRDEYNNLTKDFRTINDSFSRINASAKNPTAAGDLSLIYNYMKMLDPGSVVRESEFAQAAASGSYGQQVQALVQRAISGKRLDDGVRADFVSRAGDLYASMNQNYEQVRGQYKTLAERNNIDPVDVLPDFRAPKPETGLSAAEREELSRLRQKYGR